MVSRIESIKLKVMSLIAYTLPFAASLPPLVAWSGLMTVPVIIYLVLMFNNISTAPPIPDLTSPITLFNLAIAGAGLLLLLYSVVYLWRSKSGSLVTRGPYRLCRHPQYFSLVVFTLMMTYQSVRALHTDGIGWLTIGQTKLLWSGMLFAYLLRFSLSFSFHMAFWNSYSICSNGTYRRNTQNL